MKYATIRINSSFPKEIEWIIKNTRSKDVFNPVDNIRLNPLAYTDDDY